MECEPTPPPFFFRWIRLDLVARPPRSPIPTRRRGTPSTLTYHNTVDSDHRRRRQQHPPPVDPLLPLQTSAPSFRLLTNLVPDWLLTPPLSPNHCPLSTFDTVAASPSDVRHRSYR